MKMPAEVEQEARENRGTDRHHPGRARPRQSAYPEPENGSGTGLGSADFPLFGHPLRI